MEAFGYYAHSDFTETVQYSLLEDINVNVTGGFVKWQKQSHIDIYAATRYLLPAQSMSFPYWFC